MKPASFEVAFRENLHQTEQKEKKQKKKTTEKRNQRKIKIVKNRHLNKNYKTKTFQITHANLVKEAIQQKLHTLFIISSSLVVDADFVTRERKIQPCVIYPDQII